MQIRIFTISIHDAGEEQVALNRFLGGNRILRVDQELVRAGDAAFWSFCVTYLSSTQKQGDRRDERKVDYKHELDAETFARFERYRTIRKTLADEKAVPAFAVFSNAELATIAALPELSLVNLRKIPGIGAKKIERYGEQFLQEVQRLNSQHEANGRTVE